MVDKFTERYFVDNGRLVRLCCSDCSSLINSIFSLEVLISKAVVSFFVVSVLRRARWGQGRPTNRIKDHPRGGFLSG